MSAFYTSVLGGLFTTSAAYVRSVRMLMPMRLEREPPQAARELDDHGRGVHITLNIELH